MSAQTAQVQTPDFRDPIAPAVNSAMDAYSKTATVRQASEGLAISKANSTADIAMKAAQTAATVTSAQKTAKETEILNARAKKRNSKVGFMDLILVKLCTIFKKLMRLLVALWILLIVLRILLILLSSHLKN